MVKAQGNKTVAAANQKLPVACLSLCCMMSHLAVVLQQCIAKYCMVRLCCCSKACMIPKLKHGTVF